ncbi:signal peptide peptidase SppA [Cardinium endosymbiont of Culicoides punctatus]|uniref:signal peptide peptidase SppA n=1 Tax=Cardinium endosymbiont of Culicoides punctatus TaxID=2304601 RepID=UPI00105875BD|nr:signal peptide peptidase SppA [Cardinium endosymbiont of Culicoides punctatus]TDG95497.1 Protease 4 [Cardinium endosymbiont of Culicoides punctatus]
MKTSHFIKQVLAVSVGFFLSLLFLFIVTIWGLAQLVSNKSAKHEVKENSILALNMEGRIAEFTQESLLGSNADKIDLSLVKGAIHKAANDNNIKAIYLKSSYCYAGWAALEEIRDALLSFKKQGKTIIAYGDAYSQKSYYLASVADEIILNPSGGLEFQGLSATISFYTKFFQNIYVNPIIFRIGDYKSAVEPFCLNKMSEESKQQTRDYLTSIYTHFLKNISLERNIKVCELKKFADNLSVVLPTDALGKNMITKIAYETEAKKLLAKQFHKSDNELNDRYLISYKKYLRPHKQLDSPNNIAVVVAEGEIVDGVSSSGLVGSSDFVKTIAKVKKDPTIKAVVLRINSPGGSVLASDIIWKSIEELKKVKPVVASMSSVVASGGYYIATPCNYIFAQPTTLTGSIGIFAILFDATKLMEGIGIQRDVVKTAPSADFLNPRTSCSQQEKNLIYKILQSSYDDFLQKVAQGRGLSKEQVTSLASGKIYSGIAAQKNKLVDELGGIEAAIAKAAELANLTGTYGIDYFPYPKTKLEQLLQYANSNVKIDLLSSLYEEYPMVKQMQAIPKRKGIQAILPYTVDIE